MKIIVAIDPGKKGGIAWNDADGRRYAVRMPDTEADTVEALGGLLIGASIVIIERVGGFIGEKGKGVGTGPAMFNFGQSYGLLRGIVLSRHVSLDTVSPQTWLKTLGMGKKDGRSKTEWKNALKARAQEMFPDAMVNGNGNRITADVADALLLWEYGRRTYGV
jgi:hypothetical protein